MDTLRQQQLERDRRLFEEKAKQSSERLSQCQAEHQRLQMGWDAERHRLMLENSKLREEQANNRSEKSEAECQISSLQLQLQHLQQTSSLYQERTTELQNLAENRQKQVVALEQQLHSLKQQSTHTSTVNDENYSSFLKQQLAEQMDIVRLLEAKNRQLNAELRVLRANRQNVELINEESASLRSQIDRLQKSLQKSSAIEVESIRVKDEINQWKSSIAKELLGMDPSALGLHNISKSIAEFQRRYQQEHAKLQAALRTADERQLQLNEADTQISSLSTQVSSLESTRMEQIAIIKNLEQRIRINLKEIGFLREQLRSYDQEEVELMSGYDHQKSERIRQLEELVDELKKQQGLEQMPTFQDRDKRIRSLEDANSQLQADLKALNQELARYEAALGQGGYDAHRLRVIQLANNPASRAFADSQRAIEQLKAENAALRSSIKTPPDESAAGANSVARSGGGNDLAADLSRQLQAAEKRLQRLREMFTLKIDELRESIAAVLGYRWDLRDDGFDLLSVYAAGGDGPSKSLRFTKVVALDAGTNDVEFNIRRTEFLDLPDVSSCALANAESTLVEHFMDHPEYNTAYLNLERQRQTGRRLCDLVGICARNLQVPSRQLYAVNSPRSSRHNHRRQSSHGSTMAAVHIHESGNHHNHHRRSNSGGNCHLSSSQPPSLPASSSLTSLHSLSNYSDRRPLLNTFFTISVSRRWKVTDAPILYASEVVPNSLNPTWTPLDLSLLSSGDLNATNNILVRLWALITTADTFQQTVRLLIEWQLDLSGLVPVCKEHELYSCAFPPNTLLFTLEDGVVYTAPEIIDQIKRASSVTWSTFTSSVRSGAITKESCSTDLWKLIADTKMRIISCQESLEEMIMRFNEPNKRKLSIIKEELLNQLDALQKEIVARQAAVESLQAATAEFKQRLVNRRAFMGKRSAICSALQQNSLNYQAKSESLRTALINRQALIHQLVAQLVDKLSQIYPVKEIPGAVNRFSIRQIPLVTVSETLDLATASATPMTLSADNDPETSTATGYAAHLIMIVARLMGVPLRFPILPMSSRSRIVDFITSLQQYQESILFPLFSKGMEQYRYEYAVFLLNKNIEQLLNSLGVFVTDLRPTLGNLNLLLKSLSERKSKKLIERH